MGVVLVEEVVKGLEGLELFFFKVELLREQGPAAEVRWFPSSEMSLSSTSWTLTIRPQEGSEIGRWRGIVEEVELRLVWVTLRDLSGPLLG